MHSFSAIPFLQAVNRKKGNGVNTTSGSFYKRQIGYRLVKKKIDVFGLYENFVSHSSLIKRIGGSSHYIHHQEIKHTSI